MRRSLGLRFRYFSLRSLPRLPLIRLYLLAVYVLGICFIILAATLRFGFESVNGRLCYASIILGLVFYVVDKVLIYLFLVERAHVIRCVPRRRDYWYILNLAIVSLGFGSIIVLSFMYPVNKLSPTDHKCRTGLPFKINLALLTYDITVNVFLSCHFVYFARMKKRASNNPHHCSICAYSSTLYGAEAGAAQPISLAHLRIFRHLHDGEADPKSVAAKPPLNILTRLARGTLKGMCIMLSATVVNLAIQFHMSGGEEQWMFFLLCSLDGRNLLFQVLRKGNAEFVSFSYYWNCCPSLGN